MSHRATIPMKVSTLTVDPFTSLPVVILCDDLDRTRVAICVGLSEASAIAAELDGIELERPMTHHLTCNLLRGAGAEVLRVEVTDLVDSTFFAAVHLKLSGGGEVVQDARPSDALALALHTGAEIRVATRVLDKVARARASDAPRLSVPGAAREPADLGRGALPVCAAELSPAGAADDADFLDALGDEAFGKWKM